MKHVNPKYLPWFAAVSGLIGLLLRLWLSSLRDAKGLLPYSHISVPLLLLLTALTLLVLTLCARSVCPDGRFRQRFCAGLWGGIGNLAAAVGILLLSITQFRTSADFFRYFCLPAGVLAACALVWAGLCRFRGKIPPFITYAVVTVYLMLNAVSHCRSWGTDPQLMDYFFEALASVFLMLTAYHRTALTINRGNYCWFVFTDLAALFFCCMCLNTGSFPFYPAMAVWSAVDFCNFQEA